MSSTGYSAEIHPEPGMRMLVLASGLLLGVLGFVMLSLVDAAVDQRVILGLAWLFLMARELWRHGLAYSRNGILRISAGGRTEVQVPGGDWRPAELCSGSIVLSRLAWLRVSTADGARYAELLRGLSRESEDWRRFQVIWRHIGAHH